MLVFLFAEFAQFRFFPDILDRELQDARGARQASTETLQDESGRNYSMDRNK